MFIIINILFHTGDNSVKPLAYNDINMKEILSNMSSKFI